MLTCEYLEKLELWDCAKCCRACHEGESYKRMQFIRLEDGTRVLICCNVDLPENAVYDE